MADENFSPFSIIDGKEFVYEELALAELLRNGVLFCNTGYFGEGDYKVETVVLFVNCNDLFAWGCADAEPVTSDEIGGLYKAWKSGKYGVDKWCCAKRNQRPQKPVEDRMRKEGEWDDMMESLALNTMDAQVHAQVQEMLRSFVEGKT